MHSLNSLAVVQNGKMKISFSMNGSVQSIMHADTMISRHISHSIDSVKSQCILRRKENGIASSWQQFQMKEAFACPNSILFKASALDVEAEISYTLAPDGWKQEIIFPHAADGIFDLIFILPLGMGDKSFVLENELYASQYLAHSVFSTENGFVLASRQNLRQKTGNPCIQTTLHGEKAISFATDMNQLYSRQSRQAVFSNPELEARIVQNEHAVHALQSAQFKIVDGKKLTLSFMITEDCRKKVSAVRCDDAIMNQCPYGTEKRITNPCQCRLTGVIDGNNIDEYELAASYPKRFLIEKREKNLLSFFIPHHVHIVTKNKEQLCSRSHGTILISGGNLTSFEEERISTTTWINGIFNSHIAAGNTNYNKFLSTDRNLYSSGMHIYVDGKILALPSVFEIGLNYTRWIYKCDNESIIVTTFTSSDSPDIITSVKSEKPHEILITTLLTMGKNEIENDFSIQYEKNSFTVTPDKTNPAYDKYPDLSCTFSFSENVIFTSDEVLLSDGYAENPDLIGVLCSNVSELKIHISAIINGNKKTRRQSIEFEKERNAFEKQVRKLVNGITIKGIRDAEMLNETIYMYAHDALIHYLMPHGLEQQSGAAWGTRDICQGPFEFLLSFAHYDALRNILLNIFAHQSIETGQWYQWFMFDRYEDHFTSCHGDIVFWPLKCLASYILHSSDLSILNEMIPYIDTAEKESLEKHLNRALDEVSRRFIPDTKLITYAGGDWDDTLQPVDETLKNDMVSSWTQALAYETLSLLSQVLKNKPYIRPWGKILQEMKNDYDTFCVKDGVVAGMCILKGNKITHLLHPSDTTTGIHYRLISITRSIIAGLRTKEEAEKDIQLIEQQLQFPDGVHLMDSPVPYSGGECHLFRRGECAASVGREISLEYVHANIRYIQALCKTGYSEKSTRELLLVNPILICDRVSNALPRQSNVYFSSSDGQFADRYEYQRHFNLLKDGNITVDGGWRLYSSGPGIYITQLITSILGIEIYKDVISISPCLSSAMYPLDVSISLDDSILHLKYEQSESEKGVFQNRKKIDCLQKVTALGKRYYIIKWKNIAKDEKIIIKY